MGLHQNLKRILILPEPSENRFESTRPRALILQQQYDWRKWDESRSLGANLEDAVGQWCEVSISHDGGLALATALVPVMEVEEEVGGPWIREHDKKKVEAAILSMDRDEETGPIKK